MRGGRQTVSRLWGSAEPLRQRNVLRSCNPRDKRGGAVLLEARRGANVLERDLWALARGKALS
eukprot:5112773-Pleurochrysis_carterae.AAC.2